MSIAQLVGGFSCPDDVPSKEMYKMKEVSWRCVPSLPSAALASIADGAAGQRAHA
jgi:hypothetical protein